MVILLHPCPLCQDLNVELFHKKTSGERYYLCQACGFISLDPQFFLKPQEEHERYLTHQNDVEDPGYQGFLKFVVEAVLQRQKPTDLGLDYGCGPSSVVSYLLKTQHYQIFEYDPYFKADAALIEQKYDYLVCTEVIEHFYRPLEEFAKLNDLLKPGGFLYLKTSFTDEVKDFARWHYHRDPTHVSFYSRKSLDWLAESMGWRVLEASTDRIVMSKNEKP